MLGEKGQESAPFELLIAVIIMGFVLFIGLQAMAQLNDEKCYNEITAKLEEMKTKLETAVSEGSPQQLILSTCYNPQDEKIQVRDVSEQAICAENCGAAKNLCLLLYYHYGGGRAFTQVKCLNVNPGIVFPTSSETCPEKQGYQQLVDFREEIVQGNYLLTNKTGVTDTFPKVCAYRQKS